jgi:hypothetical protein
MEINMATMAQVAPGDNAPRLNRIATLIPNTTSQDDLLQLRERYESASDPVVAATPTFYRQAIRGRIHELLARTCDPAVTR